MELKSITPFINPPSAPEYSSPLSDYTESSPEAHKRAVTSGNYAEELANTFEQNDIIKEATRQAAQKEHAANLIEQRLTTPTSGEEKELFQAIGKDNFKKVKNSSKRFF